MDDTQFMHLVALTMANAVIVALPLFLILRKTGKSHWLALVALFPYGGGIILIWILAILKWGGANARSEQVS